MAGIIIVLPADPDEMCEAIRPHLEHYRSNPTAFDPPAHAAILQHLMECDECRNAWGEIVCKTPRPTQ